MFYSTGPKLTCIVSDEVKKFYNIDTLKRLLKRPTDP